jgi:hypothetical protein
MELLMNSMYHAAVLALCLVVGSVSSAPAAGKIGGNKKGSAPPSFKLRGSDKSKQWSQLTNNQWANMLPSNWEDKGFHFYSRIRERGPSFGINTPADLELEMNKGQVVKDTSGRKTRGGTRYRMTLNVKGSDGKNVIIVYDVNSKSKKIEFVTLSLEGSSSDSSSKDKPSKDKPSKDKPSKDKPSKGKAAEGK